MLVLDLGIGRVGDPECRHGRAEQALLDIGLAVRVLGSSHHGSFFTIDGIAGMLRPSPVFSYSLRTFGWIKYFRKSLATVDVFCPLRDQAARLGGLARHRLAVIAERQAHRHDVVVILLVLDDRDLGRDRAVEVHHDLSWHGRRCCRRRRSS